MENRKSSNTVANWFTYVLDVVGNRTKMTEANGGTADYGYDNVDNTNGMMDGQES